MIKSTKKIKNWLFEWNKWRKYNINSSFYHILVLFKFIHSPTLELTLRYKNITDIIKNKKGT